MAPKNPFKFGTDLWDTSNRFETSWLLSPYVLFACRALIVSCFIRGSLSRIKPVYTQHVYTHLSPSLIS